MKVQIEKTFPMPSAPAVAWALLKDVEAVATCMPGAAITERTDATHYRGTVSVRVGPAGMSFRGTVEVVSVDEASQTLRLLGKGTDNTGTSGASMDLTARVQADPSGAPDACELVGTSEVSMSGKAATFGGRMMGAVADQVLKQFAGNFAAKAQALQVQQPAAAAPAGGAVPPGGAPAVGADAVSAQLSASTQRAAPASAATAAGPASAAMPAAAKELDGLALMWAVFTTWLRGIFQPNKK